MFTIKKYKRGAFGYTAYGCKSYQLAEQPGGGMMILLDPQDGAATMPTQAIYVDSEIYIENAIGKTIDHLDCVVPDKQAA